MCAKRTQIKEVFLSVCSSTYYISDPADYFWLQRSSVLLLILTTTRYITTQQRPFLFYFAAKA